VEVSFSVWVEMSCTQSAKEKVKVHENQCQHPRCDKTRGEISVKFRERAQMATSGKITLGRGWVHIGNALPYSWNGKAIIMSVEPREHQWLRFGCD
jgi:hypothetical protein